MKSNLLPVVTLMLAACISTNAIAESFGDWESVEMDKIYTAKTTSVKEPVEFMLALMKPHKGDQKECIVVPVIYVALNSEAKQKAIDIKAPCRLLVDDEVFQGECSVAKDAGWEKMMMMPNGWINENIREGANLRFKHAVMNATRLTFVPILDGKDIQTPFSTTGAAQAINHSNALCMANSS